MKRAKSLFIISLLVIPLLFTAKSMAQSLTSSQYPEEVMGYSQQYSFFPFVTERFSNTHLNPFIWNYNAQTFRGLSGTSLPFSQYYPDYCYLYYNQPGNFWYGDFYHQLKQSLRNPVPGESPEEPSIDGNSEEIKIITEDDHGKTFTFHIGDEFIVKPHYYFYPCLFGTMTYTWAIQGLEYLDWNNFNPYGSVDPPEFHFQAGQAGEYELVLNCYRSPFSPPGALIILYNPYEPDLNAGLIDPLPNQEQSELIDTGDSPLNQRDFPTLPNYERSELIDTFKITIEIIGG